VTTIEVQVDEETLERLQRLAKTRNVTLDAVIRAMVRMLDKEELVNDPLMGMFADEPELMDQIVADAMKDRGRPS
jgi:hypothetical protein